mmetsp:Transcript_485/g.795  ORF Transcript_485/g.795 Transcript_485/m.795 type:complete len:217 (-) Transcript_485:320-970(-)
MSFRCAHCLHSYPGPDLHHYCYYYYWCSARSPHLFLVAPPWRCFADYSPPTHWTRQNWRNSAFADFHCHYQHPRRCCSVSPGRRRTARRGWRWPKGWLCGHRWYPGAAAGTSRGSATGTVRPAASRQTAVGPLLSLRRCGRARSTPPWGWRRHCWCLKHSQKERRESKSPWVTAGSRGRRWHCGGQRQRLSLPLWCPRYPRRRTRSARTATVAAAG